MPIYAHGTRGKYAQGCQCNLCVLVHAAAPVRRPPKSSVPSVAARPHLQALHDAGSTWRELAERTGYPKSTLHAIATGRWQFVGHLIAEDILSIPLEVAA